MPQKQKESAEGILGSSWNCCMSGNRLGDPNLVQNWLRRKQCEDCTVPGSEVLAAQLPGLHRNQSLQPPLPSKLGSSNLAHKPDSMRPSLQNNTSLTQVKWLIRHSHTPVQKQNDWEVLWYFYYLRKVEQRQFFTHRKNIQMSLKAKKMSITSWKNRTERGIKS